MGVITISRQMGSLGRQVAHLTAERLGYRVLWRELMNEAALRAGAPAAALSAMDELGLLGLPPQPKASRAYCAALAEVMREFATAGNVVIVGRAGQVILRNFPGALHIRVIAPLRLRIERTARDQNISLQGAKAQVEASDRFRKNYLRKYYRARWDDPELYDLVLSTERLTPADAADLIVPFVASRPGNLGKGA